MRALALALLLGSLAACGERLSTAEYSDQPGAFVNNTDDPEENLVMQEVRSLPFKHVEWEYKFSSRRISRMTQGGDHLFIETPEFTVIAMDRFNGRTSWMFKIDTETPLDWPPVVASGVPEEIRELEARLRLKNREIDDKLKEVGVGKETIKLQKERAEIRERLRVAAYGDNVYFISRQVLYCLDRLSGGLRWTRRLPFIPSAQPFAIRNYVFVPAADLARVWALDVEQKGLEVTSFKAGITARENQVLNTPIFSDPSLYFVCHDGNVYCFKVSDGSLTWTYSTERSLRADPTVYVYRHEEFAPGTGEPPAPAAAAPAPAMGAPAPGAPAAPRRKTAATTRFLFVGGTDNAFYALDGDGGNLLWKYECGAEIKTPAIAKDNTVYVKTEEGALHAFEVMPMHRDAKSGAATGNRRNGNLRWKLPLGERFLFKGQERVYVMGRGNEIWAVNEMTGETLGRYPTQLLQFILSNTLDDRIYAANAAGYVFCLKESRQSY